MIVSASNHEQTRHEIAHDPNYVLAVDGYAARGRGYLSRQRWRAGHQWPDPEAAVRLARRASRTAESALTATPAVASVQALEPFDVFGFQPAELIAPSVVGRLADLQLAADVGDVFALAQQRSAWADLLRGMPFPAAHRHRTFPPTTQAARLSLDLDQPSGGDATTDLSRPEPSTSVRYRAMVLAALFAAVSRSLP